jgi:D-glycero-D-manno-heptose 1,7-bisphosphate phosphatase
MHDHKALFLDRDGIINIDHGYTYQISSFTFVPGIFSLASLFQSKGYQIFVVTNQSGSGRGYYTLYDFEKLTEWMIKQFDHKGISIKKVFYCPHTPEDNCSCRKPKIGMIEQALEEFEIDLAHSWIIGDKQSDINLAHNAHISNSIAIGNVNIQDATHHFNSIQECLEYLQENQGKIL